MIVSALLIVSALAKVTDESIQRIDRKNESKDRKESIPLSDILCSLVVSWGANVVDGKMFADDAHLWTSKETQERTVCKATRKAFLPSNH